MGRPKKEETSVLRDGDAGVKAKSIGKTDVHRSFPSKQPLLPLFLVPTVCFENSCTKSGFSWGAAMPRCNYRKEEIKYGIFLPQSPRLTTGKPMGQQGKLRDGTNTNPEANRAQGLHLGREVSTVELAKHALTKQL